MHLLRELCKIITDNHLAKQTVSRSPEVTLGKKKKRKSCLFYRSRAEKIKLSIMSVVFDAFDGQTNIEPMCFSSLVQACMVACGSTYYRCVKIRIIRNNYCLFCFLGFFFSQLIFISFRMADSE